MTQRGLLDWPEGVALTPTGSVESRLGLPSGGVRELVARF
jgi:hypothetical protein